MLEAGDWETQWLPVAVEVPHDMRHRGGVCLSKGGRHLGLPHAPLFVFIDSFYVLLEMAFVYLPYDCSTLVYAYAHESQSLCVYSRCSIWPDGQTEPHTAHIITIII